MLKHYITWQFKKWWPLLLIFSIILTLTFTFTCFNTPLTYMLSQEGYGNYAYGPTLIPILLIPALGLTLVMSLFVFDYRVRRQSADTYYQAAYAPTTIKRVRLFMGAGIVLTSILAAFILGTAVLLLRYFTTPESVALNETWTQYRLELNWGYYFLSFLVLFVSCGIQYFINCFLVSLGDYIFDQICLLLFGNVFLGLVFIAPVLYLNTLTYFRNSDLAYGFLYSFVPVGPSTLIIGFLQQLQNGETIPDFGHLLMHCLISSGLYLGLGIATIVAGIILPDPSGEHADKAGARNKIIALVPHGAALVLGIMVASVGQLLRGGALLGTLPIFLFSMYAVVYYALLALWRHGFKLAKFDLIYYLSVVGVTLLLLILSMSLTIAN